MTEHGRAVDQRGDGAPDEGGAVYDVVVIGAGPVGENAADAAVQGGLTVAVVESELVGGECSYWACMPSKALLRSGQVRAARAVPGAREAVTGALDASAVLGRRDACASHYDDRNQVVATGTSAMVAAELATAWRDLGSEQVVVLERGPRLLTRLEPFAFDAVTAGLRVRGVEVRLDTAVVQVDRPTRDGPVALTLSDGSTLVVDELLVAVGRRPRTDDLGVQTVGLEPGEALEVDDTGRVGAVHGGWLYASGDVNGRTQLTHEGKYQARAVGDAIVARVAGRLGDHAQPWGRFAANADHAGVPQVVFSDPEVASVGLTEQQAGDSGLVVDSTRQVVVGATFVGPDVAEMLHAATIAVVGEVPLSRLWHTGPALPAVASHLATTSRPTAPRPGALYDTALRAVAAGHPAHLTVNYRGSSWPAPVKLWSGPADTTDLSALDRLDRTLDGGADVLDLGCGPGRHAVVLHGRGHRVLGVDSSYQAVELARRRGAPALRADALGPLPGSSTGWDAVLLLDGNIGIGGDPLLLLCRVRDLLRPTGRVLVELDADGHSDRGRAHLTAGRRTGTAFAWARLDRDGLAAMAPCAGLHLLSGFTRAGRHFALLSASPT